MKKFLFLLVVAFVTVHTSAQITVYEYKDDKAYCTFELDTPLYPDSTTVKGMYRTYNMFEIPFFEMTFDAKSTISEIGDTIISITPTFYYHSYRSKLIGDREIMDPEEYQLHFKCTGSIIEPISTDEEKAKVFKKSRLAEKAYINPTTFPESFTKVRTINWKPFPKELKKSLQDKDNKFGRKYR